MKRFLCSLIVFAMIVTLTPTATAQSSDENAIREAFIELTQSRSRGDAAAFQGLQAEGKTNFGIGGALMSESGDLDTRVRNLEERYASGQDDNLQSRHVEVRMEGTTGIVTAYWNGSMLQNGTLFEGPMRVSSIWAKRSGDWKEVHRHVSYLNGAGGTTATSAPTRSTVEDASAIKALNDEYAAAVNAQDPARMASLYSSDALYMGANSPGVVGRERIQAYFENSFKFSTPGEAKSVSLENQVAGNWAFDRGKFTYSGTRKADGERISGSLMFLQVLERQRDGSWKINRRMYHSDQPATQQ